jgi:hypothetical protein
LPLLAHPLWDATEFVSIFTTTAIATWTLNVLWLAVLAAPVSLLWNSAVVPLGALPSIGYGRAFGLLLLWFVLRQGHVGVQLSTKARDSKTP